MSEQRLFFIGDIHGDWTKLHRYLDNGITENSDLIQVGDMALGYDTKKRPEANRSKEERKLGSLNKKLEEINCNFYAIRGNHCDGSYWLDSNKNQEFNQKYSNITLLPDYYTKNYFGKKFLFVGGGISVDRHIRTEGRDYWSDEEVNSPRFPLSNHDVLISHTCPSYFNHSPNKSHKSAGSPLMKWAHANDPELEADLIREREIMDHVVQTSGIKEVIYGHYHNDLKEEYKGIRGRCLNIDELFEYEG